MRWVTTTDSASTTVQPSASASARPASAIHTAGRPKAGSVVGMPASWPTASPGSIASWWPAMTPPRATSVPRTRMTYSCESSPTSSRMRTGGMTMPSSEAIWRRIVPTRCEQRAARLLVDQRHEAEADRQLERVERERLERRVARGGRLAGGQPRRPARRPRRLASRALFGALRSVQPTAKNMPPMSRNGIFGSAGTSAKAMITTPATIGALR